MVMRDIIAQWKRDLVDRQKELAAMNDKIFGTHEIKWPDPQQRDTTEQSRALARMKIAELEKLIDHYSKVL